MQHKVGDGVKLLHRVSFNYKSFSYRLVVDDAAVQNRIARIAQFLIGDFRVVRSLALLAWVPGDRREVVAIANPIQQRFASHWVAVDEIVDTVQVMG